MKRVYKQAAARAAEGGWGVALDGRPMRTPTNHELIVPSAALAEAVAAEWDAQQDAIRTMPLTRLAATAIDRTRTQRELVAAETANYAGTDLVCYRADHPPALIARQHAGWQPLIDWAMQRYDAALAVTSGIVPQPQSPAALKAFAAAVAAQDDFRLTALHAMTTACGSLVIALALIEGRLDEPIRLQTLLLVAHDAMFRGHQFEPRHNECHRHRERNHHNDDDCATAI